MILQITKDADELNKVAAGWLVDYIREVLTKRNRFTFALSGGNTPKALYRLLASDKYAKKIDWPQLHFFWGDERYVPLADERNNARMAFDNFLDKVPVQKENIHIIPTDTDPDLAAAAYQKILNNYFAQQLYTFDLVLLGLGDNSHTLSLFPGYNDIIFEKEKWVKAFYLEEQKTYRITLTAPVVNNAARVAYLVTGKEKSKAVQQVIEGKNDPSAHPAQVIKPLGGGLYWFIDEAAAADLQVIS